jgi:two-component sensor histidine kinase
MSIATVQQQLEPTGVGNEVEVNGYLTALCTSLAASMIDKKPITLRVTSATKVVTSNDAILLGLVTTELVINALKHGFPGDAAGTIEVIYETDQDAWRLGVVDNGIGIRAIKNADGLGTGLVDAMAQQLKAVVERDTGNSGTAVWLVHRLAALPTPLITPAIEK